MPAKKENKIQDFQVARNRRLYKEDNEVPSVSGDWAVSYSDLLMILIVFFIIFFNVEHAKKTDVVQKVIISLQKELASAATGTSGQNSRTVASVRGKSNFTYEVIGNKKSTNAKIKKSWSKIFNSKSKNKGEKNGVFIELSDDLFNRGNYQLTENAKSEIKLILRAVKPYKESVSIVFIGHTDNVRVNPNAKIIDSNMVLSSLRASKAVEFATNNGFDKFWVSAQGMADNNRNTRSLSIRILER